MQQYRLNYTLLIGLAVGTLVASGAVYGLWKFQIERKSGVLISEAEKAREASDYRNAVLYYSHYLSIHGSDDDTRIKLAEAYADRIDQEDVAVEEVGLGMRVLETTVRELPDAMGVQRRLVELYGACDDTRTHWTTSITCWKRSPTTSNCNRCEQRTWCAPET